MRLNQPSLLTPNTRSYSLGSLSGKEWLIVQTGGVQQHVDAAVAGRHLADDLGDRVPSVRSTLW